MITIKIDELEFYDDKTNTFIHYPARSVDFEYSLKAVALWEGKWKEPFLSIEFREDDIRLPDFYRCMATDPTLPLEYITDKVSLELANYIGDSQTATTFSSQNESKPQGRGKQYTSEEIYALMFMNSVPLEMENRNLHRLLVVLRVISVYTNPPKKMSQQEIFRQNQRLNEERKKKYNTKG